MMNLCCVIPAFQKNVRKYAIYCIVTRSLSNYFKIQYFVIFCRTITLYVIFVLITELVSYYFFSFLVLASYGRRLFSFLFFCIYFIKNNKSCECRTCVPYNTTATLFVGVAKEKRDLPLPIDSGVETVLTHLDLVTGEGKISNAALLLFGKHPQKFFISSKVKCAPFYGNEITKPIPSYQVFCHLP